jgi:hypothetical protein
MALEPASAAALACAETIGPQEETWVMIGTGSIAKWPPLLSRDLDSV